MTVSFVRMTTTQYIYGINLDYITHWYLSDDVLRIYFVDGTNRVFRSGDSARLLQLLEDNSVFVN